MSDKDIASARTTNRRRILRAVAGGALTAAAVAGTASADDSGDDGGTITPEYCAKEVTQYDCRDSDCSCSCDCECDTVQYERKCCEDPYGKILGCGSWYKTDRCCSYC